KIEASPEEMDRAALAKEGRAELEEHPLDFSQDAPMPFGKVAIVGRVGIVLVEADRIGQLVRHVMNADLDAELLQRLDDLGIEIGDRPRIKPDLPDRTVVGRSDQRVIQKVQLELEAIRDGRRGQAPGRDIENNVPGMIEPWRLREPDLANDLGPEMQGWR